MKYIFFFLVRLSPILFPAIYIMSGLAGLVFREKTWPTWDHLAFIFMISFTPPIYMFAMFFVGVGLMCLSFYFRRSLIVFLLGSGIAVALALLGFRVGVVVYF